MTNIVEIVEVRKNQFIISFNCDYCNLISKDWKSHFDKKKRHYCNMSCYSLARKHKWTKSDQPTWRGGVSNTEAHKRWKKKNPERMAHLKAMRYARERSAEGSYTLEQWNDLCGEHNNRCTYCGCDDKLTKDHIIPLSKGGSNYITNIQPLCKSCNSKKHNHIHENKELLED